MCRRRPAKSCKRRRGATRAWNYVGSVAHWIYPAVLRSHPAAWRPLMWWLSLIALIGARAGAKSACCALATTERAVLRPIAAGRRWHHWLGLGCMLFVLTWIFSGWLSMDDGRLFSTGKPTHGDCCGHRRRGMERYRCPTKSTFVRRFSRWNGSHSAAGSSGANASASTVSDGWSRRRARNGKSGSRDPAARKRSTTPPGILRGLRVFICRSDR